MKSGSLPPESTSAPFLPKMASEPVRRRSVGAGAAVQPIVTRLADDTIVAVPAIQGVAAKPADDPIVAVTGFDDVAVAGVDVQLDLGGSMSARM